MCCACQQGLADGLGDGGVHQRFEGGLAFAVGAALLRLDEVVAGGFNDGAGR